MSLTSSDAATVLHHHHHKKTDHHAPPQKNRPPCTTTKSWEDISCQAWALAPRIISRLMHQLMQHSAGRNYNIMHTNILVLLTSHCGKSWRCRASIQASWTSSSPARPVQPTSRSTSRSSSALYCRWWELDLSLSLFFCNRTGADARGRTRVWHESTVEMKTTTRGAGREKGQHGWGMGRWKRADGEKEKGEGRPWRWEISVFSLKDFVM
jgi:hypothetical protein